MGLTPETLVRHELVGLDAEVVSASNPDLVGLAGEVIAETTGTLGIGTPGRVSRVPKADATFTFDLPADDAADARTVTVDGGRLVARPARRTEQRGDSTWR